MKKWHWVHKLEQVIDSVVCDKCKEEYTGTMELQEFHHIKFQGGYGSVFGDMNEVECDICQYCLKDMIGDIARIGVDWTLQTR